MCVVMLTCIPRARLRQTVMETDAQATGHVLTNKLVIWKALIKPSNMTYVTGTRCNSNDANADTAR